MIEVKNVVKSFDGFHALDGLTMTVPRWAPPYCATCAGPTGRTAGRFYWRARPSTKTPPPKNGWR